MRLAASQVNATSFFGKKEEHEIEEDEAGCGNLGALVVTVYQERQVCWNSRLNNPLMGMRIAKNVYALIERDTGKKTKLPRPISKHY